MVSNGSHLDVKLVYRQQGIYCFIYLFICVAVLRNPQETLAYMTVASTNVDGNRAVPRGTHNYQQNAGRQSHLQP